MENSKLKIAFWGTPELTVPILDELANAGLAPAVVITQPDRPAGRKMLLTPPAAKVWALAHNIQVLQPEKLDNEFFGQLANFNIDISLVVAYGKIMPEELINLPRLSTLNIHYSLLPKWRGATPVESAILAGETETGVSIQMMRHKLDSGPIVASERLLVDAHETAHDLRARLNDVGKRLLVEAVKSLATGTATLAEQNEREATSCGKIAKEDGLIDPSGDAVSNYNKFRAYFGWPGIYFFDKNNKRVKITKASLVDGKFTIEKVIPEGKKEIAYTDFLRAYAILP